MILLDIMKTRWIFLSSFSNFFWQKIWEKSNFFWQKINFFWQKMWQKINFFYKKFEKKLLKFRFHSITKFVFILHSDWKINKKWQKFFAKFMKKVWKKDRYLSHFCKLSKVTMQESCRWKLKFESKICSFSIRSRFPVLKKYFLRWEWDISL